MIDSNAGQFATRGDEWGALKDVLRDPSIVSKRKPHPDGFIEWSVREDDSEDVGPNPHVRPLVRPEPSIRPKDYDAKRRMCSLLSQAGYERRSRLVVVS